MRSKEDVAQELVDWHFQMEPGIQEIYIISSNLEDEEDDPINLLEVDAQAVETGHVDAFRFNPAGDITYPSVVALITPYELEQIKHSALDLPAGWSLEKAKRIVRPRESALLLTEVGEVGK
jgi:hypothetical protein